MKCTRTAPIGTKAKTVNCLEAEKYGDRIKKRPEPALRQIIAVICGSIVNTGNSRRIKNDG
jgi:hypothetical protein